jgi:hypothetical protein
MLINDIERYLALRARSASSSIRQGISGRVRGLCRRKGRTLFGSSSGVIIK